MNILLVTPGRLPVPATKGGAVETLINLLLDYNEYDLQNKMLVTSIWDHTAENVSPKYRFAHFEYIKMGKMFMFISEKHFLPYRMLDYFYIRKVIRLLKKRAYLFDYIVIENELVNGYVMNRYIKGNYIYHAHNHTLRTEAEKRFLRSCDHVIGISDYLTNCFQTEADLKNAVTVYNGIDTELFQRTGKENRRIQLREKYGIREEETVVVFAGRIVPEKGVEELLKAFIRLPKELKVKLLILGASFFQESKETQFIKKLKKLCQDRKEDIIFAGYVNHEDMPDYYCMADIGCVPSMWDEPFGLTVVEQMSMELPVITTDAGAIPEIVNDSCGIMLARNQNLHKGISSAITVLAKDRGLCRRMGQEGRKIVCERFSQAAFCEKWFETVCWRNKT